MLQWWSLASFCRKTIGEALKVHIYIPIFSNNSSIFDFGKFKVTVRQVSIVHSIWLVNPQITTKTIKCWRIVKR